MLGGRGPKYYPTTKQGLEYAKSSENGIGVALQWHRAFPDSLGYGVLYNIYFSTDRYSTFVDGVKFVSISNSNFTILIDELTPGEMYYFSVKAAIYDKTWYDPATLPDADLTIPGSTVKIYSESLLSRNMTDIDTEIPIIDIDQFPNYGIVRIGHEIIQYSNKDISLGVLTGLNRGMFETKIRKHDIDGFDGVENHSNNLVNFFVGIEDENDITFQEMPSFAYPEFSRTDADGYLEVEKDLLTTDLGGSDGELGSVSVDEGGTGEEAFELFPSYDYSGWRRREPSAILAGECVGSYIGGQRYCADGEDGVGRVVRGLPANIAASQREEMLLETTGESVVLIRRKWTGIRCNCFVSTTQIPDDRCPNCYGVGFVGGYDQFYNPRRSDGRILVRFEATEDDVKIENSGWESSFAPSCWTLSVPALKDRDFIIRFNSDGTEEFRYEVINVTRNKLFLNSYGKQSFKAQRVRKFDPITQWLAFKNTATEPVALSTSISAAAPSMPPHIHNIIVNEHITSLNQINQTTSTVNGHNHSIINGVVQTVLGHTHTIVI